MDQQSAQCLFPSVCTCSICSRPSKPTSKPHAPLQHHPNHLGDFIKALPSNFPLWIVPTIFMPELLRYFNGTKQQSKIYFKQVRNASSLRGGNVQVYLGSSGKIVAKYVCCSVREALYLQQYSNRIPIRIEYDERCVGGLQSILQQRLRWEQARFHLPDYALSEQFLQWVSVSYGETVLCTYWTALVCALFQHHTKSSITSAVFHWLIDEAHLHTVTQSSYDVANHARHLHGKPMLSNVTSMNVRRSPTYYSFQDQYKDRMKLKIEQLPKARISVHRNSAYQSRLNQFKQRIQLAYQKEQSAVLLGVEQDRKFEYEHDSTRIARLLNPDIGEYTNIREVLNDEEAFTKLFCRKKGERRTRTVI